MLWCRFGLQEMMCGWFTTLKLLGKELCLGEGLSPNALSSCLLPFWSSRLLLYAAWYAMLLEAGWNILLFEAGWSNGLQELLCSSLARFCYLSFR
jgi:hypothetical protein